MKAREINFLFYFFNFFYLCRWNQSIWHSNDTNTKLIILHQENDECISQEVNYTIGRGFSKTPFFDFLVNRQIIQTTVPQSLTSGTRINQLLCRKLTGKGPIKKLQRGGGGVEETWGRVNRNWWWFPAMLQEAREITISVSVESLNCQKKRMQMSTQKPKFTGFNTKKYLKRN